LIAQADGGVCEQEVERQRWLREHVAAPSQRVPIQDKLRELSLAKPEIWRALKEKELQIRFLTGLWRGLVEDTDEQEQAHGGAEKGR
jgi:hypothetical protein